MADAPIFEQGGGEPFLDSNDKLLAPDSDTSLNAHIGSGYDVVWSQIEGYAVGATVLLQYVIKYRVGQDELIYPIMFLYRQYLELVFKTFVLLDKQMRGLPAKMPKGHELVPLWNECRPVLPTIFSNEDGALNVQLDQAEQHVHDFAALDESSQALRYPFDKHGLPFRTDIVEFSVDAVYKTMTSLCEFLSTGVEFIKIKVENIERQKASEAEFLAARRKFRAAREQQK